MKVPCSDVFYRDISPDQIGRNPGLQAIWEDEKQRRRENNQASQIDTPDSQGEPNQMFEHTMSETMIMYS